MQHNGAPERIVAEAFGLSEPSVRASPLSRLRRPRSCRRLGVRGLCRPRLGAGPGGRPLRAFRASTSKQM
eukprot:2998987-Alexandrium_andersonii.AAC.1